jgi:hypothetical protein
MRVHEVDERDSSWEDNEPVYRVYLFRGGELPEGSWTTWTYDVHDADLLEVAEWAQHEVGDSGLYAVALVRDEHSPADGRSHRGLVWLIGNDANGEPLTPREGAAHERMQSLRGKAIRFG